MQGIAQINMDKNIKVLQLIDSLQIGGAEVMAVNIANALHKRGIASHLVVSRKEGPLKDRLLLGVEYLFLDRKRILDISTLLRFYHYIKKHHINIIHAHATSWFLAVLMKMMNPSLKIIWHDHFGDSEKLPQRPVLLLKLASIFFSSIVSVNYKLQLWAKNELHTTNCIYLPNFITPLEILLISNKDHLNGESKKRIICLANLRPQKDHINLLKSFVEVQKQFPDWTLHLIGSKSDEIYYEQLQHYINQHNLRKSVFIYENCINASTFLSQADIGVLSSQSEGLPLALLEYGWAQLGVVVTDVGECGEVLQQGHNGLLVPPNNPQILAEKIVFLIKNKEERMLLGQKLYQKVASTYSEEIVIEQFIKKYQQIG